ncbi:MAG: 2,3-bisphosphoglycerate-independent phosphoglycerate mutase [Holosporales bacterium]|nr:2,3-bisphosphoglycerate-independent phosphoglycerate mutase [Holosporales bacterium]
MRKVLLCILDGFGYRDEEFGNATLAAPYILDLMKSEGAVFLKASGKDVGLPDGQFGNSEVGHLTIGAGRVVKQKLPMITDAISSGELESNKILRSFTNGLNSCHLMVLFSRGGVHSEISHFFWAIDFLRRNGIDVKAHLFLDGRDVGYKDALSTLSEAIDSGRLRLCEIATIQGRFYAMDRDSRLDRTKLAYDAIASGEAEFAADDPIKITNDFYEKNVFDEMIPPIVIGDYHGAKRGDSFWMMNFRTDRIRQILNMLLDGGFRILNMVDCGADIEPRSTTIFKHEEVRDTLGEILSRNGISQLRIAETEKYAHVTYFMNGGVDVKFDLEDRILIPSPKVGDYSTTPEMSSRDVTAKIIEAMESSTHQVIIANFANADMIGHTGDFEATKKSLKFLDGHVRTILECAKKNGYTVILTADHGNAEEMMFQDMTPIKTHTCADVPFIMVPPIKNITMPKTLADVHRVICQILGLPCKDNIV